MIVGLVAGWVILLVVGYIAAIRLWLRKPVVTFVEPRAHQPRGYADLMELGRRVYDQERVDDSDDDHDWEWDSGDNDIHSLDERFHAIIEKMRNLPGINADDVRIAYLGFDIAYPTDGDVEGEFQAWLDTPEGKFMQYLAKKGDTNANA